MHVLFKTQPLQFPPPQINLYQSYIYIYSVKTRLARNRTNFTPPRKHTHICFFRNYIRTHTDKHNTSVPPSHPFYSAHGTRANGNYVAPRAQTSRPRRAYRIDPSVRARALFPAYARIRNAYIYTCRSVCRTLSREATSAGDTCAHPSVFARLWAAGGISCIYKSLPRLLPVAVCMCVRVWSRGY